VERTNTRRVWSRMVMKGAGVPIDVRDESHMRGTAETKRRKDNDMLQRRKRDTEQADRGWMGAGVNHGKRRSGKRELRCMEPNQPKTHIRRNTEDVYFPRSTSTRPETTEREADGSGLRDAEALGDCQLNSDSNIRHPQLDCFGRKRARICVMLDGSIF